MAAAFCRSSTAFVGNLDTSMTESDPLFLIPRRPLSLSALTGLMLIRDVGLLGTNVARRVEPTRSKLHSGS